MKNLLTLVVLLACSSSSHAGPYFRIEPLTEIKSGAFFAPTDSESQIGVGMVAPIIRHHSEDGHLFIPGIDWDLLTVGWRMPTDTKRGTLVIGPSLNLEEPIKAVLRRGVRLLPGGKRSDSYGALKSVLQPASAAEEKLFLALGPSFGVETHSRLKKWRGHFLLSATLNRRFGGGN